MSRRARSPRGKCVTGTDCTTSAQYTEALAGRGTSTPAPACVSGTCQACTNDGIGECRDNYACDKTGFCNQICTGSENCATGNCTLGADGKTYVCTAKCNTYADCPTNYECMSGACAIQLPCTAAGTCDAGYTCKGGMCWDNRGT